MFPIVGKSVLGVSLGVRLITANCHSLHLLNSISFIVFYSLCNGLGLKVVIGHTASAQGDGK